MRGYITRRLLLLIPNIFILATIIFFLVRVAPGDAAQTLTSEDGRILSQEALDQTREALGLNDPIFVQYTRWMGNMLKGDLGITPLKERPVTEIILDKAEVTVMLAVMAVFIGVAFFVPLGIIAALNRGSWLDQIIRTISAIGLSIPNFWLGILILLMLVHWFEWSPPIFQTDFLEDPANQLKRLIWPAIAIGVSFGAVATRLTRSTMLEVLNQDYVRTARAKGLRRNRVILRHAVPNAILPVLTLSSLLFAGLLGGAVVLERMFALPEMGEEMVGAVANRDHVLVQGAAVTLGVFVMLWNLVIDIVYVWLDPRIRLS
jgi:peptide/nickel transport system permease protein